MQNRITELFGIKYPIIQAGMIWNSGWRLASAVCNAGGLGLLGAGSMYPEVLREHIQKCKKATDLPFGVNVPMLYPNLEEIIEIMISMISSKFGYNIGTFTPNGRSVAFLHFWICSRSTSGYIDPAPKSPRPPALQTALASLQPLFQIIPAWMIGYLIPNNSVIRFCTIPWWF